MKKRVFLPALAFLVLVFWAARFAPASRGGPDGAGYTWIDEAEPGCSTTGHGFTSAPGRVVLGEDDVTGGLPLPFPFPFYGVPYTRLYVSANGVFMFEDPAGQSFPDNAPIPDSRAPSAFIAPYWDDLGPADCTVKFAYVASADVYRVDFSGRDKRYGGEAAYVVELWRDGEIDMVYTSLPPPFSATVGIENQGGADGLLLACDGKAAPGLLSPPFLKSICILPPPALDCSTASPAACGAGIDRSPLPGDAARFDTYPCSAKTYPGEEAVYALTLPEPAAVVLTLSGVDPTRDVDLFVLGACDARSCAAGGGDAVDLRWLEAGSYLVVADSTEAGDLPSFHLAVGCTPVVSGALPCNGSPVNGMAAGVGLHTTYSGCPSVNLPGPEMLYFVDVPSGDVAVEVTPTSSSDFAVFLFDADHLQVSEFPMVENSDCLSGGSRAASLYDRPGRYVVVIDSADPAGGTFSVSAVCPSRTVEDIACGTRGLAGTISGPGVLDGFPCASQALPGGEKIYRFGLAAGESVGAAAVPAGPDDVWLEIFSAMPFTPDSCVAAGNGSVAAFAPGAGTYYLVADTPGQATSVGFTLDLSCRTLDPSPLACGSTTTGTAQGVSLFPAHGCAAGAFGGPETLFEIPLPAKTNVRVSLTHAPAIDLDLFFFDGSNRSLTACMAHGDAEALAYGVGPASLLVLVDGTAGSEGAFTITAACGVQLDCVQNPPAAALACPATQIPAQDTTAAPAQTEDYACPGTPGAFPGPERIYTVDVPANATLTVDLANASVPFDLFLLDRCDEGACLVHGQRSLCAERLPAGAYYVVVDSASTAGGTFDLDARCIDAPALPMNPWNVCEPPFPPTTAETHSAAVWSFNSGTYCGTRCNFAMYIAAECGTEMNIPLQDVESGHIRVFSYERDAYEYLYAANDLPSSDPDYWSAEGTDVAWLSQGCPVQDGSGSPAERDPRFNNRVVNVRFQGNPTLCGIYRIELINWGGFDWSLFANCSGTNDPGFMIHDSYCGARAAFQPLPELSISNASVVEACPDVTVSFEVRNIGCATVPDARVRVDYGPGDTWEGGTGPIDAGGSVPFTVPLTLGALPGQITIGADPDNGLPECNETGHNATACFPAGSADSVTLVACDPCSGDTTPPPVPVGNHLRAVKQNPSSLLLDWVPGPDPNFAEDDHFHVYRSVLETDLGASIAPEGLADETYTDAAAPGDLYYYQVIIADGCENENR